MARIFLRLAIVLIAADFAIAEELTFRHLAGTTGGYGDDDGSADDAGFGRADGIGADLEGNIFIADSGNYTVRKIDRFGQVSTIAGLTGSQGHRDGVGGNARFDSLYALLVAGDSSLLISEGEVLRRVAPNRVVTTVAGRPGSRGWEDGSLNCATFFDISGIATDPDGSIYLSDFWANSIRKITPDGQVSTIAGQPPLWGTEDGPVATARLCSPRSLVRAMDGMLYWWDCGGIRALSPQGVVSTIESFWASSLDPLQIDSSGNLYFIRNSSDGTPSGLMRRTPAGAIEPFQTGHFPDAIGLVPGGGLIGFDDGEVRSYPGPEEFQTIAGQRPEYGCSDGIGTEARFDGVSIESGSAEILVADTGCATIRRVDLAGRVSTMVGKTDEHEHRDGPPEQARFDHPWDLARLPSGELLVTDVGSDTIRRVAVDGTVSTVAGQPNQRGYRDGPGDETLLDGPRQITTHPDGRAVFLDGDESRIRTRWVAGDVSTLLPTSESGGPIDGPRGVSGLGWARAIAPFDNQDLLISEASQGETVRRVGADGSMRTIAGNDDPWGMQFVQLDGTGSEVIFESPWAATAIENGRVVVSDRGWRGRTLREVNLAGEVRTVAGSPLGSGLRDGTGKDARFWGITDLASLADGSLVVADQARLRIGRPALPDRPIVSSHFGCVGQPFQFDAAPRTGNSWRWTARRIPTGSTARLSNDSVPNPTFVADLADIFEFELLASDGDRESIRRIAIQTFPDPNGDGVCGPPSPCLRPRWIVPAVAHADGRSGARWRTSLIAINPSSVPARLGLWFYRRDVANSSPVCVDAGMVDANSTREIDDVLPANFESQGAGALGIGSDEPGLIVNARIQDESKPDSRVLFAGGSEVERGLGEGRESFTSIWSWTKPIDGLIEDENYRTNLGLLNASPNRTLIRISAYRGNDHWQEPNATTEIDVGPYEVRHFDRIFAKLEVAPLEDGSLEVEVVEGGPIFGYVAVIDNRSGDGTLVPIP